MRHYPTSCLFFLFLSFFFFKKDFSSLIFFSVHLVLCVCLSTSSHCCTHSWLLLPCCMCPSCSHTGHLWPLLHSRPSSLRAYQVYRFSGLVKNQLFDSIFFQLFFFCFQFLLLLSSISFGFGYLFLLILTVSQDDLLRDILPPIRYDSCYKFLFKHSLATPNKSWCCSAEILSLLYVLLWPGDDLEPRCLISGDFSPSTICQ